MLKNKDIICISSIDWDFIWQGHQEIMSTFARNGNRVLFIENTGVRSPGFRDFARIKSRIKNWFLGVKGIRKVTDNLYVYSPLTLPLPYLRIARWVNQRIILSVLNKWIKVMNFNNPLIWVFLPTPLTLDIVNNFSNSIVVYYCIDNFMVSSTAANKIRKSEVRLLKCADLVFVTSNELFNYCSKYSKNVSIFPFAVNFEEFQKRRLDAVIPEELKNIKKPVIGYIGGVHKWIDLDLIKKAALYFTDYSFVFVGPLQTDISSFSEIKNVYFLGKKEHKVVPDFINNFDVCVIPYLLTEYTKNVYPTKLNEYLAMGKPVVSTDLEEIRYFNLKNKNAVLISKTKDDFCQSLSNALNANSRQNLDERIAIAKNNSWSSRIEQMSGLLESVLEKKELQFFDWKEKFIKIYKVSKKKFLKIAAAVFLVYLMVFYTPLVWFLAKPLKIAQVPQKVDAIVVLAGGVGESGQPGQGYEERVQYAVNLYKQGFAQRLIFSSGYMYVFKEPLIMESLALSLGVPKEVIILEDKSLSTYEQVNYVKNILTDKKWSSIIMVSSPYHMLRLSLVIKKSAPKIQVVYLPIPNSMFFSHGFAPDGKRVLKQIDFRQLKAILHEYLGIIYYWAKGRI